MGVGVTLPPGAPRPPHPRRTGRRPGRLRGTVTASRHRRRAKPRQCWPRMGLAVWRGVRPVRSRGPPGVRCVCHVWRMGCGAGQAAILSRARPSICCFCPAAPRSPLRATLAHPVYNFVQPRPTRVQLFAPPKAHPRPFQGCNPTHNAKRHSLIQWVIRKLKNRPCKVGSFAPTCLLSAGGSARKQPAKKNEA